MNFNNKVFLITGGTGSFGRAFSTYLLKFHKPKKIIIFSRDEFLQFEMIILMNLLKQILQEPKMLLMLVLLQMSKK